MRTITGHAGALTVAGSALNGKILGWKLTLTDKNVETTAAGDDWAERVHLNNDWTVEITAEAANQATWDMGQALVGTEVVIALKRISGDANAYFSATGLITEASVDAPSDQATKLNITAMCCTGAAPTFDTTPAT